MAAAAKSTKYTVLGTGAGPESNVLVDATNIDVSSNIEFAVDVAEALELRIRSDTAVTGAPSITYTLQGWNPAAQLWDDLVTSAAVVAAGTYKLMIGPDVPAIANIATSTILRQRMRLRIAYTGTPVTDVMNNVTVVAFVS